MPLNKALVDVPTAIIVISISALLTKKIRSCSETGNTLSHYSKQEDYNYIRNLRYEASSKGLGWVMEVFSIH